MIMKELLQNLSSAAVMIGALRVRSTIVDNHIVFLFSLVAYCSYTGFL